MKKTLTLSLSAAALFTSGMLPAQAAEAAVDNVPVVVQDAVTAETRAKMDAEAKRHWYGNPVGDLIVLDAKATAQKYQRGYVVNYVYDGGSLQTALNNEVYEFWTGAKDGVSFQKQVERYGYPHNTETVQHNWRHMSKGTLTRFYREDGNDEYGTVLAYHPAAGKVMDRSWWQFADQAIGWNESVVLGDSDIIPDFNTGYVAQGLAAAGYKANEYTAAGAGISAVGAGGMSIKNMVVDNGVALGIGTPWVVSIQASAADSDVAPETLDADLRATVAELKKIYPNARVVVNGVVSANDDHKLNELNQRIEETAKSAGAGFVATSGWTSQYGSDQAKITTAMKWAIRQAIR